MTNTTNHRINSNYRAWAIGGTTLPMGTLYECCKAIAGNSEAQVSRIDGPNTQRIVVATDGETLTPIGRNVRSWELFIIEDAAAFC